MNQNQIFSTQMHPDILPPNMTYQQKIMLLRSRFKSTKDLWIYMTERCKCHSFLTFLSFAVGYLLPSIRETRLQFLQDILSGKKLAFKQSEVPSRHVPHWKELAVKEMYPQII